jgi:hypothetical protein
MWGNFVPFPSKRRVCCCVLRLLPRVGWGRYDLSFAGRFMKWFNWLEGEDEACWLDRRGLFISKPKPGLTHEWHIDVTPVLTHEWHIVDHACANTVIRVFIGWLHDLVCGSSYLLLRHSTGYTLKPIADTRYIRTASCANTLHHDFTRHSGLVDVEEEILIFAETAVSRWAALRVDVIFGDKAHLWTTSIA